jgi:hypothetical protein
MISPRRFPIALLLCAVAAPAPGARAQGTAADYRRAIGLREAYQSLALQVPEPATWVDKSSRFRYRRSVKGGAEFILVDVATQQKTPAFDHDRLAT